MQPGGPRRGGPCRGSAPSGDASSSGGGGDSSGVPEAAGDSPAGTASDSASSTSSGGGSSSHSPGPAKRNLVLSPVGDAWNASVWLDEPGAAQFDVIALYFGDDSSWACPKCKAVIRIQGEISSDLARYLDWMCSDRTGSDYTGYRRMFCSDLALIRWATEACSASHLYPPGSRCTRHRLHGPRQLEEPERVPAGADALLGRPGGSHHLCE